MSRLAHLVPKKQFRCLPVSGRQSFRYVEIIASDEQLNNYQQKIGLVDRQSLKKALADFYFSSGEWGNENPNQLDRYYKNHRGIVVHVVLYNRKKQRVIFMLDGCDDPQCEPVKKFREKYTLVKGGLI
ncbi:TPA: DUF4222 domain-containing protein [Proteus mirabilis]